MICPQILQSFLGYINTLMIQDTLAEPEWVDRLGDADRRGLTPLFTVNMTPYGDIHLNLDRRLDLAAPHLFAAFLPLTTGWLVPQLGDVLVPLLGGEAAGGSTDTLDSVLDIQVPQSECAVAVAGGQRTPVGAERHR
jgi:hypothetical protein